jgi:hypothetical protein
MCTVFVYLEIHTCTNYKYKIWVDLIMGEGAGGVGASHVYQFLPGSLNNHFILHSLVSVVFLSPVKIAYVFSLFETMRSLKNINIYHSLVAENSLYVQHLICERSYRNWRILNPVRYGTYYIRVQLQNLETPAACRSRSRLVLNSPDFSYEVCGFFLSCFADFVKSIDRFKYFKTTTFKRVSGSAKCDKWVNNCCYFKNVW